MAPETALGKRAKCPKCNATLLIPVAILATLVEAPQPKSPQSKSTPSMAIQPVVAIIPPPPVPIPVSPIPLPEPMDVEVVEDEPAPLPPPPAPKLARPVSKPAPVTPAPNEGDIFSLPPTAPAEAPMPSGSNPFAGFVVPGSVAEQMNPKDRKRKADDEDDDKPRRKRR